MYNICILLRRKPNRKFFNILETVYTRFCRQWSYNVMSFWQTDFPIFSPPSFLIFFILISFYFGVVIVPMANCLYCFSFYFYFLSVFLLFYFIFSFSLSQKFMKFLCLSENRNMSFVLSTTCFFFVQFCIIFHWFLMSNFKTKVIFRGFFFIFLHFVNLILLIVQPVVFKNELA